MSADISPKRQRSMTDMLGAAKRILRAVATRTPEGNDMDELLMLAEIEVTLENSLQSVVDGLRSDGITWKSIGEVMGTTGQAANMRWGEANAAARRARLAAVEKRQADYRAALRAEAKAQKAKQGQLRRGRKREPEEAA